MYVCYMLTFRRHQNSTFLLPHNILSRIKFTSYKALRNNISSDWRRRFPLEKVKEDELLKAMLITL